MKIAKDYSVVLTGQAGAGVQTVDVSLEKKLVTVGFDPGVTNLEAIKHVIKDEGYTVA